MKEELSYCPLCKSGHFIYHSTVKDHVLSKESFTLHECQNCYLVFTNPRPDNLNSELYYNSPHYISHKIKSQSFQDLIYNQIRKLTLKSKLEIINGLIPEKGKLMDYGTGLGYFPKYANDKGWNVLAVEPNDKARTNSVFPSTLKDIKEIKNPHNLDIVTLFHVLEHIHTLKDTLVKIINTIKKDGYLILALPNHESYDAKKYKENWAGYDVPRHLYHFNQKSIDHLTKIYNLELIDKKPMIYDSFYVSLLSETYRKPKQLFLFKWIKAFTTGLISNKKAIKNNFNYSSILYILKKK
jgi:SAM-dependent methyltransferase